MMRSPLALLSILTLVPAIAGADIVTIPNQFQSGTPARAADVNANFDAVKSAVDANDATLRDATARIADLESQLATISTALGPLSQADASDLEQLVRLLPHLEMVELEIGGGETRPAIRFNAINVQVTSGSGATNGLVDDPLPAIEGNGTTNGLGNLIVGYNEGQPTDTASNGSHNLIVGNRNRYESYGGVIFGRQNRVDGAFSVVTGGFVNRASGLYSSISGGELGTATNQSTSVIGGQSADATGYASVAGGGQSADARAFGAVAIGGVGSQAEGVNAVVLGGQRNVASGTRSVVTGGAENLAEGADSVVGGGGGRTSSGSEEWSAGSFNSAN